MDKLSSYIVILLVFLSGLFTMPTCIEYLKAQSAERGHIGDLNKQEIIEDKTSYSITYDLNNGVLVTLNPATYTLFTDTFTLNNPTKDGYDFIGWTGTDLSEPKLNVTICKGSAGDLEFTANYMVILDAPIIELSNNIVSWEPVNNAISYTISVNGYTGYTTEETLFDLTQAKEYFIEGNNHIKVKANSSVGSFSDYSNTVSYSAMRLITPVIVLNDNLVSWEPIENATLYTVNIDGYIVTTTETEINLLNYLEYISTTGCTNIKVRADNSDLLYINSTYSSAVQFVSILDDIALTINGDNLSWTQDERASYHEIYINGVLAQRLVDISSIDILLLSNYLSDNNTIYIKSIKTGYVGKTSNSVSYVYHNLTELENLQIELDFSRTSTTYALNVSNKYIYTDKTKYDVSYNKTKYNFETDTLDWDSSIYDVVNSCFLSPSIFDNNLIIKSMAFWLELNFDMYRFTFNKTDLSDEQLMQYTKDFLTFVNSKYVVGVDIVSVDVSEMFKVMFLDSSGEYIPNKLILKIHYNDMFSSAEFQDSCNLSLEQFSSYNIGTAHYTYNWSTISQTNSEVSLIFEDINDNLITIDNDNAMLFDNSTKFKLGTNYYFIIKDVYRLFCDLCQASNQIVKEKVTTFEWTGTSFESFDITNYIEVYTTSDDLVTFNYTLSYVYQLTTGGTY